MVRHIYLCENSAEGIFSAIYRAYEEGYPHEHNEVVRGGIWSFFANITQL